MNSLKKKEWKKAIYKEYHNLNNFGTFTIILTSSGIILVNKKIFCIRNTMEKESSYVTKPNMLFMPELKIVNFIYFHFISHFNFLFYLFFLF